MKKRILAQILALLVAFSASAVMYAENEVEESSDDVAITVATEEDADASEDAESEEAEETEEEETDAEAEEAEEAKEEESIVITLTVGQNSILKNEEEQGIDVAPTIINDIAMVPLRAIFEALGAFVEWDNDTKTVFAVSGENVIVLQIGQSKMFLNNVEIALDCPSVIVDGRTMIPVPAISAAFGNNALYDEEAKTVTITK